MWRWFYLLYKQFIFCFLFTPTYYCLLFFSILINYIFKILSSTDHKKYKSNTENHLKGCVQPKARNEDRNLAYLTINRATQVALGFPGGSDGKESTCNVGDMGSIPGLGSSPGGEHGKPLQCSCLENPHGQRSLQRVGHDWATKYTLWIKIYIYIYIYIYIFLI